MSDTRVRADAAERADQGCPPAPQLELWQRGQLDEGQEEVLVTHLLTCDRCSQALARLGEAGHPHARAAWGSALAVAVLGPDAAPGRAVQAARQKMGEAGLVISHAEEASPWAVDLVGTGELGGDFVDGRALAAFVQRLAPLFSPGQKVGAYVDVGRGGAGPLGPMGEGLDRAPELAARAVPGELRLSAAVTSRLAPLGLRLRLLPDGEAVVVPHSARPVAAQVGQREGGLLGIVWGGWLDQLLEVTAGMVGVRGELAIPRGHAPSARVSFHAPPGTWLYLLYQGSSGWTLHDHGAPVATPETARRGWVNLTPPAEGVARPWLLAATQPIEHLQELVAGGEARSPAAAEPTALGDRLMTEAHVEGFLLINVGAAELSP